MMILVFMLWVKCVLFMYLMHLSNIVYKSFTWLCQYLYSEERRWRQMEIKLASETIGGMIINMLNNRRMIPNLSYPIV